MPITLRSALQSDEATIKKIIRDANINPMDLDWRRFVVAEAEGRLVGTGQIRRHGDGSRELASIAVIPERQGQGIASQIIRALMEKESGVLYLMCRAPLETFYTRFGFRRVDDDEMTPYFRRLMRLARIFSKIVHATPLVMKREQDGNAAKNGA